MSNYVMSVDFFGHGVRAETDGLLLSLTDLALAGNGWRVRNGLPIRPLQKVVDSVGFQEFLGVAKKNMPDQDLFFVTGRGNKKRTMAHIIVAIYVAEQFSTEFHFHVIKTFIEGKLLEFRDQGGTEFKSLNAAIDLYLPDRIGRDNKGVYITVAKILRTKLLGEGATTESWGQATVAQTHSRYEVEKSLVDYLSKGFIMDYEHLKKVLEKF